ncbi:MAG: amidohydrolase [Deltaproteobacteria bacterium]|jgi:predicted amidohydrolase YtcJ|nr:amidohydrolase [Deltaproteobacteria bacterium]
MTDDPRKSETADQIYVNGNILTMDADNTIAEAMIVRNGLIEVVGSNAEIQNRIQAEESITDLQGKTVLPGFIDAHGHFPGSGLSAVGVDLNCPPIGKFTSILQVLQALKDKAAATEKGNWVYGFGYDDTLLAEKRLLTRHDLDSVSTAHPVYVSHISGHLGMGNSLSLETVNIGRETPDPEGGVICREAETNMPTGVLEETAHFSVHTQAMQFTPENMLLVIQAAVADYTQYGVTTAQSGLCEQELIDGLSMGSQGQLIPIRLMTWPNPELSERIIDGEYETAPHNNEMFQIGAAKIIGDGSIQGFTANLSKPYHTPFKGDNQYSGYPVTDRQTMVSLVKKFHDAGMQIAIHGNGDATIDDIIFAISEAQRENPREDARHIIIHCQTVRDDQLQEIKRLGITPSFFPAHAYYWGDRHCDIFLGPERAQRMNPTRSALDMGIPFTIHVDTPVTPMRPLLLVWATVNRMSTGGNVIGADERITPLQALRATTIDAAWQIFQEKSKGSLEPGKFGDLVILSANPLENAETIREIEVLETVVGGKSVYKR